MFDTTTSRWLVASRFNEYKYTHRSSEERLTETNAAKIIKRLKQEGWYFERAGGELDIYRHPDKGEVQVPRHRTLSPGVARSIARKAGWV